MTTRTRPVNIALTPSQRLAVECHAREGGPHTQVRARILLAASNGSAMSAADVIDTSGSNHNTVRLVLMLFHEGGLDAVFPPKIKAQRPMCQLCGRDHTVASLAYMAKQANG